MQANIDEIPPPQPNMKQYNMIHNESEMPVLESE
jgi:hypothetical protein